MKKGLIITLIAGFCSLVAQGQNVGITNAAGGITPQSLLHVHSSSNAAATLFQITNGLSGTSSNTVGFTFDVDNSFNINMNNRQNTSLSFSTANTPRMTIHSDGRVGIGTQTVSNAKLQIQGNGTYDGVLRLINTETTTGTNVFFVASNSSWTFGANKLGIGIGDPSTTNVKMTLQANGNVGIGATSPASLFSVGSSSQFQVNSFGAIAAATGITSSGAITFSGLSTGIIHTNALGTLSSGLVNLTNEVSGLLPVANGGTGLSSFGNWQLLYTNGSGAMSMLPLSSTTGQVLTSQGSSAIPTWSTPTTGTLTNIATGSGLTGGPITSTGTISLANGTAAGQVYVTGASPYTPALVTMGGDATIASNGTLTIANNAVDGTDIALGSDAQGDIMYYNGTDWARLAAGTSGQVLKTQGISANPVWATDNNSGGTVTSIATNNGITGGTITTSGTIGLTGQALALHNLATNGLIARTGAGTVAARTITWSGNGGSITNGDGVSGNPAIQLSIGTGAAQVAAGDHSHTNMVTGSGANGHVSYWNGTNSQTYSSDGNFFWDEANNRLGIGITSPVGKVEIRQNMSDYTTAFTGAHLNLGAGNTLDNTGFVGITYDASTSENYGWSSGALRSSNGYSDFVWKHHYNNAAGAEIMRITNTGNVGIGTNNPTYKLHVAGTMNLTSALYANGTVGASGQVLTSTGGGAMTWTTITPTANVDGNGTANYLARWTDANSLSTGVTYDNGTNVGIGTTSPVNKLHLSGGHLGVDGQYAISVGSWNSNTPLATPSAQLVLSGTHNAGYNYGTKLLIEGMDNESNYKAISIVDENLNELFYIQSTPIDYGQTYFKGNVGIGTTSPSTQLHTTGGVRFQTLTGTGNRFVMTDASGNLSASSAPSANIVSGNGVATRVAFWSDANTLSSNANLYWDNTNSRLGIGTTSPAYKLDVNGPAGFNAIHKIGPPSNNPENGMWNVLWTAIAAGMPLYNDEEFAYGSNSVNVYNNSGGNGVLHFWESGDGSQPNTSGKWIRIVNNGDATSPGYGGFQQPINSRRNATFVQRFRAKLPAGYNLVIAENSQGSNATSYWLTPTAGTGKWEEYIRVSHCGNTGSFSSGGHVYVTGGSSATFTWYLGSCNVYEVGTPGNGSSNNNYIVNQASSDQSANFRISGSGYIAGNVGIGTTSPSEKLEIAGNIYLQNASTGRRDIRGTMADNDFWSIGANSTASNAGVLEIATGDDGQAAGGAEPIVVRQYGPGSPWSGTLVRTAYLLDAYGYSSFPGNVGIGTTSPGQKLVISGGNEDIIASGGGLRLGANNWSDAGSTYGHIITSNSGHNALMIVGNNVAGNSGHGREVKVWDYLNVQGSFSTTGRFYGVGTTDLVSNLNADLLDGNHAAAFAQSSHTHDAADVVSGELDRARVREMISKDTRATNPNPETYNPALQADFKQNSTNGLSDGGTYNGVLSFRPYGTSTDFSGGPMHQLGFTENGNLWMRTSTGSTTWGNWKQIANANSVSGTTNYVAKFTSANSIGNSRIVDNGTTIKMGNISGLGTTLSGVTIAHNADGSVQGSSDAHLAMNVHNDQDANNQGVAIGFGVSTLDEAIGAKIAHIREGSYSTGSLVFYTKPSSGANQDGTIERMRITANGNVGIGTTSPAEKLDVSGNIKSSSLAGTGNRPVYADANGVLKAGANDNTNWTLSANFSYSPDDLWGHGGTSGGSLSADDTYASYAMPFSLVIEGTSYSTLTISTNGWVAFGTVTSSYLFNSSLPTSTFSVPVICAYWDDIRPEGNYVRYGYVGTSPNRTVIIDYEAHTYSGDYDVRFQVQIHEGSGLINVKYRDAMSPYANGQSATIGFQLAGGSSAKAYPISYNGKVLDDNRDDAEGWSVCPLR